MEEMPVSRKYHGNSRGVSGGNHFLVADGASGLDAGGGSGVNGILDQLLDDRSGALDHLTGSDLIGNIIR